MDYLFCNDTFKKTFKVKSQEQRDKDSIRLTHITNQKFNLFPYMGGTKSKVPIVTDLEDLICDFFQLALGLTSEKVDYEELCAVLVDEISISKEDIPLFKELIDTFFFKGKKFDSKNIGLYTYQEPSTNRNVGRLASFLYYVLDLDVETREVIEETINDYPYNVLEEIVKEHLKINDIKAEGKKYQYFPVFQDVQKKFKTDFLFMLKTGMTSPEELADLLSLYYFYYVSQTCFILKKFCKGDRNQTVPLYYALDWEKVSKNRKCCTEGWEQLQTLMKQMFCHAITLEIINQHSDPNDMYDYIMLKDYINNDPMKDSLVAEEIKKAEQYYTDCIGDYKEFNLVSVAESELKTDEVIRHLFKCIETQFNATTRGRVQDAYSKYFKDFCRTRWLKNRRKSGLVLNLKERDIIFLTKLSLGTHDQIRLVELFNQYEQRGIYLDNSSKEKLQDYFTKLNLIEKKSDSGDAQYVKRIL